MPGKWGARPPLDPPMQYVPKYHQKLGCQANGGRAPGAPPPRSANVELTVPDLYLFPPETKSSSFSYKPIALYLPQFLMLVVCKGLISDS